MQLLQLSRKCFSLLGIRPNELKPTENYNLKNLKWIPIFVLNIILYAVFISKEVDNFIEYMLSVYMISAIIGTFSGMASIAFRTKKFGHFIEILEQNVHESKNHQLFLSIFYC